LVSEVSSKIQRHSLLKFSLSLYFLEGYDHHREQLEEKGCFNRDIMGRGEALQNLKWPIKTRGGGAGFH